MHFRCTQIVALPNRYLLILDVVGENCNHTVHSVEVLGEREGFGGSTVHLECGHRIDTVHASDPVFREFAHFLGDGQFPDASRSTSAKAFVSHQLCE